MERSVPPCLEAGGSDFGFYTIELRGERTAPGNIASENIVVVSGLARFGCNAKKVLTVWLNRVVLPDFSR